MSVLRLMVRQQRTSITAWSVLLFALIAGTVSAYQSTYTTAASRGAATQLAQDNPAATLVYGQLPNPGNPAQMFTWEIGTFLTILTAIMAVLTTVSVTRASEDDGTLEIIRTTGLAPTRPLRSAAALVASIAILLATGSTLVLGFFVGRVDAVTWTGAAAFGSAVGMTFLLTAMITLLLCQIAPTTADAHMLAFGVLAVGFAARAYADSQDLGWLQWCSPLALRETLGPFTHPRWWALGPYIASCLALAGLALHLGHRRDLGAGLLQARASSGARLPARSTVALIVRLERRSIAIWIASVTCFGALFSSLGSGVVQMSGSGQVDGGFLGSQLDSTDPVASYFSYSGTMIALIVSVFAVLSVLRAQRAERDGLTDHVLATGVRRWVPLGAQSLVTSASTLVALVVSGALSALVAPRVIDGTHVAARAFAYTIGQWPATLAATGLTVLLVAAVPRLSALAWLPILASAVLALLGTLLSIPRKMRVLGLFGHVPDIAGNQTNLTPVLVLLLLGAAATALGLFISARQEVNAS